MPCRNSRIAFFSGLLAVLLPLAAGCRQAAKAEGSDEAEIVPVVKVTVQPIRRAAIDETIEVLGVTQPLRSRTARVTTAIDGRVAEILPETPRSADDARKDSEAPANSSKAGAQTAHQSLPSTAQSAAVEGELVNQRQVIARLDDSQARAAVAKAEGAVAEAQAALLAQSAPRQSQLQAAEATAASAKSALETAEAQLQRLQGISELVGSAQLSDAKTAVERAKAEKHGADAHLAELSDSLANRKAAELQAKAKAAEADLRAAQMQLELTNVRSPIAGRLGRISVFLGQSLPVGSPVATVTDLRQIQVDAAVAAKRIHQVKSGQPATILWSSGGETHELAGKVTFVSQEVEPGSGSFPVSIVAENPEERLRSGVPVRANIVVRHLDDALVVPRAAVIEEIDEPYLFIVDKAADEPEKKNESESSKKPDPDDHDANVGQGKEPNHPAEKQPDKAAPTRKNKGETDEKDEKHDEEHWVARKVTVKTGIRSGDLIQVEGNGLAKGARVVTTGNYFLPDKARVEIDAAEGAKDAPQKED